MAEALKQVVNMTDATAKRQIMSAIGKMSGLWEVSFKQRRLTRSFKANRYYFAAVVAPFAEWLREQYGDPDIDSVQAHEMLKVKILGLDELLIPGTGETMRLIPRSKTLDSLEFGVFVDKARLWMEEFCGIVTLDPDLFVEPKKNSKVLGFNPKSELRKQLEGSIEMLKQKQSSQ